MRQPEGYEDGTDGVYRLVKALYGLKQAPRVWNEEIGECLKSNGFMKSTVDDALFLRESGRQKVYVLVYVDDLLLVSTSARYIGETKQVLHSRYRMKDLGEVGTYLKMQVRRCKAEGWLEVGQEKYIGGLKERYASVLAHTHPVSTPCAPEALARIRKGGLSEDEEEMVEHKVYQSIVGSLMYASTTTRPDITFAVNMLAQFTKEPRVIHLNAAARVLRYLVDTSTRVIRYEKGMGEEIQGYTDADFGSEADGRSRAAYVFKVGGGAVSWQSKKLEGGAPSTTEAEYKALTEGAKEATWLKRLYGELGVGNGGPIHLHVDNQSAISLAHNPVMHQRTKHIKIYYHFIRDVIQEGDVNVSFVRTHLQDADFLTKALPRALHYANMERVGLRANATRPLEANFIFGVAGVCAT